MRNLDFYPEAFKNKYITGYTLNINDRMIQMTKKRLQRLIDRRVITAGEFDSAIVEARNTGRSPEEVLISRGVPRHEVLLSLAGHYELRLC